jgi:predicted Rdx family selenoprotein
LAAWMATEIWHDFGEDAPVTLIPVGSGRLEVYANDEKLFDRKAEGGAYPDMKRVRAIKAEIRKRLEAAS